MKYLLFDTEGTGLGDSDEVTQLSYILLNDKLEIERFENMYCNTTIQLSTFIENLTGLNNKKLLELSKGKFLEDVIYDSGFSIESDICYMAYNVSFDIRLINNTLENNLSRKINFGKNVNSLKDCRKGGVYNLCLMRTLNPLLGEKYSLKLSDFANKYLNSSEVSINFTRYCKEFGIDGGNYHSAQFDTYILYEILKKYFRGLSI